MSICVRYVIWSESNPGKDPRMMPDTPTCLNPDCNEGTAEKDFTAGNRLKLPPSRFGYGVVISNASPETSDVLIIYGNLKEGACLHMYSATHTQIHIYIHI